MTKDAVDTTSREREGLLGTLALGVDTCGPSGSVALARIDAGRVEILGQTELAGKSYSATLVAAVGELLSHAGARVWQLNAIAVTSGPGSFTGVRVGLSAVKGLAEPSGVPVVAVSRLAVLAQKAGVDAAALDAHRHEVFLRSMGEGSKVREILAGRAELQALNPVPRRVGVCDDAAAEILTAVWPDTELVRVEAPMARDVLQLALPKISGREFVELGRLDGHYLRRSDAEIFGEPAGAGMPAHTPAGRHNG